VVPNDDLSVFLLADYDKGTVVTRKGNVVSRSPPHCAPTDGVASNASKSEKRPERVIQSSAQIWKSKRPLVRPQRRVIRIM
jgi:hypothetical protein